MEMPKFIIFSGKDQKFYFKLLATNGETILSSEGYNSKTASLNGVFSVKLNSVRDCQYQRIKSINNKFYFVIHAQNGEVIGLSKIYESEEGRDVGIETVKKIATNARIEDIGISIDKNEYSGSKKTNWWVIIAVILMIFLLITSLINRVRKDNNDQSMIAKATEIFLEIQPTQTIERIETIQPTQTQYFQEKTSISPKEKSKTVPECADASIGSGTCRISHAYCSYKPNVKGDPTFCNDAPYPSNNFTLIVWGEDWSYLNGKCLIVTGYSHLYKGAPEIEASDISQVKICD